MAYLLQVLTLLFALAVSPAFAGYAQLKPPPGWSQGMGAAVPGTAGNFSFGMAANGANFRGGTVLTNAALNVAGQMVTIPVSMRIAANAATKAAEYSFGNPWLFAAALTAPIAYEWFKNSGLQVKNGAWVKSPPAGSECNEVGCTEYMLSIFPNSSFYPTRTAACSAYALTFQGGSIQGDPEIDGTCVVVVINQDGTWPQGASGFLSRIVPAHDPVFIPIGLPEFKQIMAPKPVPLEVPKELPGVDWPIEQPIINPDPAIDPLPRPSPAAVPRPLFIPTGNPVPTADPNVWNQPGVRVTPMPTPDNPWRVNVQPENIPQNNPNPKSPNELNPPVPIPGNPLYPNPDTGLGLCDQYPGIAACAPAGDQNPKPEEIKDFCKENPTVLACQKLGDLTPEPLQTKTVPLAINQDSGWNLASASCPAPKSVVLSGMSYNFGMGPLCDFASGIRPLVVGFAWITAILGFIGLSRKD